MREIKTSVTRDGLWLAEDHLGNKATGADEAEALQNLGVAIWEAEHQADQRAQPQQEEEPEEEEEEDKPPKPRVFGRHPWWGK